MGELRKIYLSAKIPSKYFWMPNMKAMNLGRTKEIGDIAIPTLYEMYQEMEQKGIHFKIVTSGIY